MNGTIILIFLILLVIFYIIHTRYEFYMENDSTIVRLKNKLIPHFPKLKNIRMMKANSSYTINKHSIYICTEHDGIKYDDNMLVFVILHELAHVETPEIGHGKMFKQTFYNLLAHAKKYLLWNPELPRAHNYCKSG
jgi:predicted metal-dependent hydrolase